MKKFDMLKVNISDIVKFLVELNYDESELREHQIEMLYEFDEITVVYLCLDKKKARFMHINESNIIITDIDDNVVYENVNEIFGY